MTLRQLVQIHRGKATHDYDRDSVTQSLIHNLTVVVNTFAHSFASKKPQGTLMQPKSAADFHPYLESDSKPRKASDPTRVRVDDVKDFKMLLRSYNRR